jgi:hypothetical protein
MWAVMQPGCISGRLGHKLSAPHAVRPCHRLPCRAVIITSYSLYRNVDAVIPCCRHPMLPSPHTAPLTSHPTLPSSHHTALRPVMPHDHRVALMTPSLRHMLPTPHRRHRIKVACLIRNACYKCPSPPPKPSMSCKCHDMPRRCRACALQCVMPCHQCLWA